MIISLGFFNYIFLVKGCIIYVDVECYVMMYGDVYVEEIEDILEVF